MAVFLVLLTVWLYIYLPIILCTCQSVTLSAWLCLYVCFSLSLRLTGKWPNIDSRLCISQLVWRVIYVFQCNLFVKVFPLLFFFSSQFHLGLNDNFSLAPDGPWLQVSPVSFSPAPRGLISSKTRGTPNIPRDGPVEIPNTEELYRALSLRTENSKDVNENNGWVFERSVTFSKFFHTPFIDVPYSFNGSTPLKGYSIVEGSERTSLPTKQSSCGDSLKEKQIDSNTPGAKQARRISEHARNVKKALQLKRSSSGDL